MDACIKLLQANNVYFCVSDTYKSKIIYQEAGYDGDIIKTITLEDTSVIDILKHDSPYCGVSSLSPALIQALSENIDQAYIKTISIVDDVKKIDKKYLPVGEPDWNVGDNDSEGYIKNRTHYRKIGDYTKLFQLDFDGNYSGTLYLYRLLEYNEIQKFKPEVEIKARFSTSPDFIKCTHIYYDESEYIRDNSYYISLTFENGIILSFYGYYSDGTAELSIDPQNPLFANGLSVELYRASVQYVLLSDNYIPSTIARQSSIDNLKLPPIYLSNGFKEDDVVVDALNSLPFITTENLGNELIKLYNSDVSLPSFTLLGNNSCKKVGTCLRMYDEIDYWSDREPSSGSSQDEEDFNNYRIYNYIIDFSETNNLCISAITKWDHWQREDLDAYLDKVKFTLQPKGGVVSDKELTKLAQERIITPALTEEVY